MSASTAARLRLVPSSCTGRRGTLGPAWPALPKPHTIGARDGPIACTDSIGRNRRMRAFRTTLGLKKAFVSVIDCGSSSSVYVRGSRRLLHIARIAFVKGMQTIVAVNGDINGGMNGSYKYKSLGCKLLLNSMLGGGGGSRANARAHLKRGGLRPWRVLHALAPGGHRRLLGLANRGIGVKVAVEHVNAGVSTVCVQLAVPVAGLRLLQGHLQRANERRGVGRGDADTIPCRRGDQPWGANFLLQPPKTLNVPALYPVPKSYMDPDGCMDAQPEVLHKSEPAPSTCGCPCRLASRQQASRSAATHLPHVHVLGHGAPALAHHVSLHVCPSVVQQRQRNLAVPCSTI
eukprot:358790-Chlamydomonas_euryale.AAC.3